MADLGEAYTLKPALKELVIAAPTLGRLPVPARDLGSTSHIVEGEGGAGGAGRKSGQLWPRA